MMERQIVSQKKKEFEIQRYVMESLRRAGLSGVKIQRTPLGERIIVFTSRPGLVVGRGGSNINKLTSDLKSKFKLENPQIEISEVKDVNLNARIVADRIASSLERYGSKRFKSILHKSVEDVTRAGALGVEIILSGKIPSARARSWRVYAGYLRKCGEGAIEGVDRAITQAKLKSGIVGVKVNITPPDINLIDRITLKKDEVKEEIKEGSTKSEQEKSEKSDEAKTDKEEGSKENKEEKKEKHEKKSSAKSRTSKKKEASKSKKSSKGRSTKKSESTKR